jgi:3-oxoadipate enol-lactonase
MLVIAAIRKQARPLCKAPPRRHHGAMSKVQTSFGVIGVDEAGGGPATPILFLHGVGSDKSVWHPQLAAFAVTRRAIAIDYPGYGESEPRKGATRDDFARAALAALDKLEIERAHICGLSLGGVVAIAMHALAPERCASLILADSFAIHPDGQAIYDRSVAASESMTMRELAEARAPSLLGAAAGEAIKAEVIATMGRIDPAAYRQGAQAVWLADQRDRAAAIAVPTLILVGDEDRITPPALSQDLAELVPSSALEVIAGAGHLANLEQPAAFNRSVKAFLAGVDENREG